MFDVMFDVVDVAIGVQDVLGALLVISLMLSLTPRMYWHSTLLQENMQWWSTLNSKHHCSLEREEGRSVLTSAAFTLHLTCKKIKKKAHILLTWCGSQVAAKLPQQQLAIDLGTSCSICLGPDWSYRRYGAKDAQKNLEYFISSANDPVPDQNFAMAIISWWMCLYPSPKSAS